LAHSIVADEFNSQGIERRDELHQGIDIAADDTFARFHALNGRQGKTSRLSELALIDAEDGAASAQLASSNHGLDIRFDIQNINYNNNQLIFANGDSRHHFSINADVYLMRQSSSNGSNSLMAG
jgi:hypothetical protein